MSKVHMIISAEPLAGDSDREAFCGEIIKNAHAVPFGDFEQEQANTILFCRKCFGTRYFYVCASAQEALNIEKEVADA